ncbi:Protein-export protein SecB (maintains pre-export unfolded state) [hydrothermal vent metagenome]|uniref:Protein-export protein SecB (Maintains pre-export unfolded state) n=1 Tax=hydrothermal vent metagenome TaxID=652676 RepID=A0A3B1BPW9_9ZZZZ
MADTEDKGNGQEPTQQFAIQKIYVKDLSFESPNAPAVFTTDFQPQVNVELNTNGQSIGENVYEVVLSITVTVKQAENTAYLVEVQQSGIFNIEGMPEDQMAGMLAVFCPSIIFPYAREAISDIVTRGGFPQLLLAPVDFNAMYTQHLEQQQAQQATH